MNLYPSGARIAGRYEVAGRPLMGGMGIVYLCFDHQEQRPVALKTFRPEFLPDRAARDRFLQEGETWVRLGKHPHIVRCYQVFQDSPRPEVYLALELVAKEEGRRDASLRAWITPGQPLPAEQALLIALQIARGMAHAAETIPGFVHRDLKPENVLVGADRLSNAAINRVRVTDFGLVQGPAGRAGGRGAAGRPGPRPFAADPRRRAGGHAALHGAGAMGGRGRDSAGRHLRAGLHPGRDADRAAVGAGSDAGGVAAGAPGRAGVGRHAGCARRRADLLAGCLAVEPGRRYDSWLALEAALAAAYSQIAGRPAPAVEPAGALSRAERVAAGWSYSAMGVFLPADGQCAGGAGLLPARTAGWAGRRGAPAGGGRADHLGRLRHWGTSAGHRLRAGAGDRGRSATARRGPIWATWGRLRSTGDAGGIGYHEQALAISGDRRPRARARPGQPGECLPPTRRCPAGHWLLRAGVGDPPGDGDRARRGRHLGNLGNA